MGRKGPRIVLNAVEKWGKTTLAANMPNPAILMAKGETGYETLLASKLVPSVLAARIDTWDELLGMLDDIHRQHSGIETVVLDAMGGFERLCHEFVCKRDFDNDWSKKGFLNFQDGYSVSVNDWLMMLARLDKLADAGLNIMLLSHTAVSTFNDPMGDNFDRYAVDCHKKTWSVTHKWADAILFGKFLSIVDKATKNAIKGKGVGGTQRIIYTGNRDAFVAGNRYQLPDVIDVGEDPAAVWQEIDKHIRGDK